MRSRALVVLGSLVLLVAACGDSDDDTTADTAVTVGEASSTTDTTGDAEAASDIGEVDEAGDQVSEATARPADPSDACAAVDLSAAPDEPVTIRMGHGASSEEPLYLQFLAPDAVGAQYSGVWYEIEATEFTPPDRLAAYQAGALDAGTISTPQLFTAVGSGLEIAAVASIAVISGDNGFTYPYLALEGAFESPADLEGATIGIIAPNTATEYWAKSAVAAAGLDPDRDVSYVAIPVPNAEQALRDGQTDVQFFIASFHGLATAAGGVEPVFDALTGPGFDHELLDVFFDRGWIDEHPEAFCAWRSDYQASMSAYVERRAELGQILLDEGFDAAPSIEAFAGRPDDGRSVDATMDLANLQALIDDMQAIGFLPSDLAVTAEQLVLPGYSLTK